MNARWGNTEWISQNEPVGEPCPLIQDSVWVGWACGGSNAVKARQFLKSDMQPRSLWPDWDDVSADGWPILSESRSLWPEGIYQPISQPGIHEIARGTTGDGCDAED